MLLWRARGGLRSRGLEVLRAAAEYLLGGGQVGVSSPRWKLRASWRNVGRGA